MWALDTVWYDEFQEDLHRTCESSKFMFLWGRWERIGSRDLLLTHIEWYVFDIDTDITIWTDGRESANILDCCVHVRSGGVIPTWTRPIVNASTNEYECSISRHYSYLLNGRSFQTITHKFGGNNIEGLQCVVRQHLCTCRYGSKANDERHWTVR